MRLRKIAAVLVLVVVLHASEGNAQRLQHKLIGSWEIDVQGSKELGEQAAEAVQHVEVLDIQFSMEFTTDGKFSTELMIDEVPLAGKSGKWAVLTESDDRLILEIINEGEPAPTKMIAEFLTDGRLKLSPETTPQGKDPTLLFKRRS